MKSFWLIIFMVASCSVVAYAGSRLSMWADSQIVGAPQQIHIITRAESKKVMEYHGILSMEWSIAHHDFVFYREGILCRARAFEILKETK